MSGEAHKEAAAILRRIVDTLRMPVSVASYLRGHADGLDASAMSEHRRRRKRRP